MSAVSDRLPRLMIADDDPVVRLVLTAQLRPGFDIVAVAGDADEAIALAVEHLPDVAIVDLQMPGGGGLRAAREMRARAPATAIVVLSAERSGPLIDEVIGAGAIAAVPKGVTPEELTACLLRSIDAHARLIAGRAAAERTLDT